LGIAVNGRRERLCPNRHDRRRGQPTVRAIRAVGFDEENMKLLGTCVEKYGRPIALYTDKPLSDGGEAEEG
jgi:hypothetical protein